jgi:hypothetical protein
MARGLLDRALLEGQLLADAVFEEEVCVVHAAGQLGAEEPLKGRGSETESVFEEPLRPRKLVSGHGVREEFSS